MMMQRSLSILSFAAAATSGGACGTIMSAPVPGSGSDMVPDAGMTTTPDGGSAMMPDAGMPPPPLARSCKALLDGNPGLGTGIFTLGTATNQPYQAYCDMTDDGGGWTLVLKVDGSAAGSAFGYDNPMWTNTATIDEGRVDTSNHEAKYRSYSEVTFTGIRIVMIEAQSVAMTLDVTAPSFMNLMRGPFIPIGRPRQEWLGLIPGAVVQPNCNLGGINNFVADPSFRVRIGMIANTETTCASPDSFIGIGGGGGAGNGCYPSGFVPPSAGAIVPSGCGVQGGTNHKAFAQVYVR